MAFNSYLFERDGGCVAVDPLPLDDESLAHIEKLGSIRTIVLTNRDHERDAENLRQRFGARILASAAEAPLFAVSIDATFGDRDEIFAGAYAVSIPHGKTAGEVALSLPQARAAVVGDALIGSPAGGLSLLPDAKLANREQFVFALRRLWELQLESLLLGDGQPLFGGADSAIGALLEREGGPAIHRVNLDEIHYAVTRSGKWACGRGEVGLTIGARKLGYQVVQIPPGGAYCPVHWHVRCEEFFYVIEGRPSIRTQNGTFECRTGDFIAFPVGDTGAHQVMNASDVPALVMLAGGEENADLEVCVYPDSDKVGVFSSSFDRILRASPELDYYDGE
jgi:uncharacterized cupin superfamily protein